MGDFAIAVALVLVHEGGYVPPSANDPGGETNFGIAKRWHPNLDIKNLTREDAEDIYQREYWEPYMAAIDDQNLCNCVLDCSVNQGPGTARSLYASHPVLRDFQVARLVTYAISSINNKPQYYHSWFSRTLDC